MISDLRQEGKEVGRKLKADKYKVDWQKSYYQVEQISPPTVFPLFLFHHEIYC